MQPTQTLYISNLNDKVHKTVLKEGLYLLFSQFGRILSIFNTKSQKMRGQAFICFANISDAMNAMQQTQGRMVLGKPLKIQYAKTNSNALKVYNGEYPTKEMDMDITSLEEEEMTATLYVQNLPSQMSDDMLAMLFQQYEGFMHVRLVPGRMDVAFIAYQSPEQASVAKQVLQNFLITKDKPMRISFAQE